MAVKRIDFPEAPSGSVDAAQRAQLDIGYSGIAISTNVIPPNAFVPRTVHTSDILPKVVKA